MSNQIFQIEEKGVPQTITVLLKTYVLEKTAGEEEKQDDTEPRQRWAWTFELAKLETKSNYCLCVFWKHGIVFHKTVEEMEVILENSGLQFLWAVKIHCQIMRITQT